MPQSNIWAYSTPVDDSRRQSTTPQNALERLPNQRPVQLFTIDPNRYIGPNAIPLPQDHKRRFLKEQPAELQKRIDYCAKWANADCNAFDDPTFRDFCGICVAADTSLPLALADAVAGLYYSPNERIDNPNNPNPIPTFGSCPSGAFALTKAQCIDKKQQYKCKTDDKDASCGTCVETQEIDSFPLDIPNSPAEMLLGGIGELQVFTEENPSVPYARGQLEDGIRVPLGQYGEGNIFILKIKGPNASIAGILSGPIAGGRYVIDIAKIIDVDSISGTAPRKHGFIGLGRHTRVLRMVPGTGKQSLELPLRIPMTFLDPDDPAVQRRCASGPIARTPESRKQLGMEKCSVYGARPGNYPIDCLQYIWTTAGCTPSGRGYPRDLKTAPALLWKNTGASSAARTLREIHEFIGDIGSIAHSGTDREGRKVSALETAEAVSFCLGPARGAPRGILPGGVMQRVLAPDSSAPKTLKEKVSGRPTTINGWFTAAANAFSNFF